MTAEELGSLCANSTHHSSAWWEPNPGHAGPGRSVGQPQPHQHGCGSLPPRLCPHLHESFHLPNLDLKVYVIQTLRQQSQTVTHAPHNPVCLVFFSFLRAASHQFQENLTSSFT